MIEIDEIDYKRLIERSNRLTDGINYLKDHIIVGAYSPLFDEEEKQLDDEFSFEDLLYFLEGSDKE